MGRAALRPGRVVFEQGAAERLPPPGKPAGAPGDFWRCPPMRRRPHHSGHFRALGDGGSQCCHHCGRAVCLADFLRRSVGPLSCPEPGNGAHRQGLGPIMIFWFIAIAGLGLMQVLRMPGILAALDPRHAVNFFVVNRLHGVLVLGSVVLCITGCEALYADMGHFGRGPIRLSWIFLVFPALLLNYFGQTALVLEDPQAAVHPFYGLVPRVFSLSHGGRRHNGRGYCLPGHDLRCVFPDAAGHSDRLLPPVAHRPHSRAKRRARSTCPGSTP